MTWGALALLLGAELVLEPGVARPGDVVLLTVTGVHDAPTGRLGSAELTFLPAPRGWQALVGLGVEQKAGRLEVDVTARDEQGPLRFEGDLEVKKANFRRRELTISKRFTSPSRADQQHAAADQVAFKDAFDRDFEPYLFTHDFAWPRNDELTAPFGDVRLLNGKQQSQHMGIDLDGNTGDPIYAANDGEVAMARDCFASGNTVLLHHGARLFTSYFHLSRIDVKAGQQVKQGQQLGLMGKTGRVTGPHLHFGVKVDGKWVNPEGLFKLRFAPVAQDAVKPPSSAAADAGAE
jgi:murein DD-endopeptidase MepM/ murein hydrolase activator NlpD